MENNQRTPKISWFLIFMLLSLTIILGKKFSSPTQISSEPDQGTIKPTFFLSTTREPETFAIPTPITDENKRYFVASFGDDNNPGTEELPWKTIQKAANTLAEGETAFVLEEEYDERVIILNSGINLEGIGTVIMRGFEIRGNANSIKRFAITDPSSEAGLLVEGDNNLLIENEIYHMKQDGIWFFGNGNIFKGNFIHDILSPSIHGDPHADCFQTWGPATNIVFDGNLCLHNRSLGSNQIVMVESINTPVNNLTFKNNIFVMDDPSYSPMNFHRKNGQDPITNILIINNNFIHRNGIGQYGIRFVNIDNVTIQNNLFIDYGTEYNPYIKLENNVTEIKIGYNAIYKSDGIEPMGGPYENDLWMVDPKLEDYQNLNFTLTPESPLIDNGIFIENLSLDFNGINRPQGEGIDIGALEYQIN